MRQQHPPGMIVNNVCNGAAMKNNQLIMQRVLSLLAEKGMHDAAFARAMGVEPSYVGNWKKRGIPADRLPRVADVLGVSLDYLSGRIAAPIASSAPRVEISGQIPVIGYAKLGDDGFFAAIDVDQPSHTGEFIALPSKDPRAYAIKCLGLSMAPRIQPGEYVIAEPNREPEPGDEVVVFDVNGRVMVKRYLYWRDDQLYLQSINKDVANVILPRDEIRDINPVLAIVPRRFVKNFID